MARECPEKRWNKDEDNYRRGNFGSILAPRDSDKKCYNCNGYGHIANQCPEENEGRNDRGYRNNRSDQCYNCRGYGHISRDCPKARVEKECFTCHRTGHMARDCPEGDKNQKSRECYKCHEEGHLARDCRSKFFE
jgi:cellular nucleic acid-binding protein